MPQCVECEQRLTDGVDQYQCRGCGEFFCGEHRLPETHDCPFAAVLDSPGTKLSEESKYDTTAHQHEGDPSSVQRGFQPPDTDSDDALRGPKERLRRIHGDDGSQGDSASESESADISNEFGRQYEPDTTSPDVAPDGSIKGEETDAVAANSVPAASGWPLWLQTPVRTLWRLTLLAIVVGSLYALFVYM